ncbi:MAG: Rab family GTPase [Candidatus Hodarchaeota archaeon]
MPINTSNPLLFRISIIGEEGIGKDIFINAFTSNQFLKESDTGLGVAFYKGSLILDAEKGQQECVIWIWDLKEREGYKNLHSRYLKGTNGIMLFFDLTNRKSFNKIPDWIKNIRNSVNIEIPILLVGNRGVTKKFLVSPNEINNIIREFNLFYIETSLTTKEGIYDSFYCMISLTLGVEVDHQFFLSKDIIYYPQSSLALKTSTTELLTSQDLSKLSQQAIFRKIESLEETYERSTQIKIPIKLLVSEVVLSIGVISFFIIEHFLRMLLYEFPEDFEYVDLIPELWSVRTADLIKFLLLTGTTMQLFIAISIIVSYIKSTLKKTTF